MSRTGIKQRKEHTCVRDSGQSKIDIGGEGGLQISSLFLFPSFFVPLQTLFRPYLSLPPPLRNRPLKTAR